MAAVMTSTARSNAASVLAEGWRIPLILRTYWRAPASISSGVADGSRPRRMVMFRHMLPVSHIAVLAFSRTPPAPRDQGSVFVLAMNSELSLKLSIMAPRVTPRVTWPIQ